MPAGGALVPVCFGRARCRHLSGCRNTGEGSRVASPRRPVGDRRVAGIGLADAPSGFDTRRVRVEVLDYVVLIVADLDRALDFYTGTLGLSLQHRAEKYAQMRAGTTRLSLYTRAAMSETLGMEIEAPSTSAPAFELGFKVTDCDAAFAELVQAGAPVVAVPTTRPWGQRTAYVRDPDGNLIELAEDVGARAPTIEPRRAG